MFAPGGKMVQTFTVLDLFANAASRYDLGP